MWLSNTRFFLVFPLFKCIYIKIHIVKGLLFSQAWHRDIYYTVTRRNNGLVHVSIPRTSLYIIHIVYRDVIYSFINVLSIYVFLVHLLNCVFHFKIVFIHVHLCTKTLVPMIFTCTYMYMYIQNQEHSHEIT